MRILHIVGSISPAAGGPTEAIRMMIRYAPSGYSCEVVTLDDPAASFLAELPFPVHALGAAKKRWYSAKLIPWLRANRQRFDGVIVHGLWEFTGLGARLALGVLGRSEATPYVVFPHGMLDPYFKRRFPAKHFKKWIYWLAAEYWVLSGAERVLFTTALERDLARQSFWFADWTSMVVALGSEPPPDDTERLLQEFHAHVPGVDGKRFLLFLGRIDPKKSCDLLVQAFASVAQANPGLHLVMAGPDASGWSAELQSVAEKAGCGDRIHWPGMLRGGAKWGAFAASDAFILPSHQENFGIAVVEALASGKPVLLSDQINIAQDVVADGCGLVEPDTLSGTARLLERWLAVDPADREAMGSRALASFATRYDMRRNTAAILRVFERMPQIHPQIDCERDRQENIQLETPLHTHTAASRAPAATSQPSQEHR